MTPMEYVRQKPQKGAKAKRRWTILWILIPILAVGILFLLSINYLIDPTLYRNVIEKSLTLHLGREVTIGRAKIGIWGGLSVAFEDFRIKDLSTQFDLLRSKGLILRVRLLPLLKREIQWKRVVLDGPAFHLIKDKEGRFNFLDAPLTGDTLKSGEKKWINTLSTLFGGSLTLRNGSLSFSDESFGDSPWVTEIHSLNLEVSGISYRHAFPVLINGKITHLKTEGEFSVSGNLQMPEDMDLSKGSMDLKVEAQGINTSHFWPYLKPLLPMNALSGILDLNGSYQGSLSKGFKASGKIKFKDLVYDHPRVFAFIHTPKWANLDLEITFDKKVFDVSRFLIELPDIWVKAKGKIYGIGTKEMGMDAEAQSGPFDLSDAKQYIPYKILATELSERLHRSEGSGTVRIVSVRLSGKMPEVEHCDQPQYAHTLSVEVDLDRSRVRLPWDFPLLENLKGHLLFKGGHLNLKEVDGKFLHSTIDRINGIFYWLLRVPTAQVNIEGKLDLVDFPSLMKMEGLSGSLSETLSPIGTLSGKAGYKLFLKGELKAPLNFRHQGVYQLSKVRFTHRDLPFPIFMGEARVDLSNESLQWSGAMVEFGNSSLLMSGSWKKGESFGPVEITSKGRADLRNLLSLFQTPLFPEEIQSKTKGIETLSGTGQLSFKASRPAGHRTFFYEGELTPREVSFLPKGISLPLTFREGTLSFSNLGLNFRKMRVISGNSILSLDGSIEEGNLNLSSSGTIDLKPLHSLLQTSLFSDPLRSQMAGIQQMAGRAEVRLKWLGKTENWSDALKEGEIKLKGVSVQYQAIPVPLSHIDGSLSFSPEQFRLEDLKGKIGDSALSISGVISNPGPAGSVRSASLQISSPDLDLDPLLPKQEESTPISFEKVGTLLSNWNFDIKVEANQGSYRGLQYRDLKIGMKTVDQRLFIRPLQFRGLRGDFWGEGWIQPSQKGIQFEIKPRVSNMEAKSFLRVLLGKGKEEKVELSGRVHIDKVELRGEGEDFQRVKESLSGMLRLEFENGVIERFNILSKIFSVLNVSQLFKLRFPDLKTKGLPYRQIAATVRLKEGVASTEDFLVDSDAIRITILGKVDLGKNQIDARVGVHPLGTVDTVLSNVPIVGYILTGRDKAFLSVVYEVKGPLEDPKIEAIPIKGAGEGFLGIIRRILETPLRPFQKSP